MNYNSKIIQTNIRAGNDQRQMSGFGLVFPSSIILITATERMSGFVLITNLPVNNASGMFIHVYPCI